MSISVKALSLSDNININPNPYEEMPVVKNSLGKLFPLVELRIRGNLCHLSASGVRILFASSTSPEGADFQGT